MATHKPSLTTTTSTTTTPTTSLIMLPAPYEVNWMPNTTTGETPPPQKYSTVPTRKTSPKSTTNTTIATSVSLIMEGS